MSSRYRRPAHEPGDFKKEMERGLDSLDTQRLESLERMRTMQAVETRALEREHERLSAKYGAGHRRVRHLADQIDYSRTLVESLDREIEKARIDVPDVAEGHGLVHGLVLAPDRTGLPDLTVWFVDGQNRRVESPEHTCTDERGYFAVQFPVGLRKTEPVYLRVSDSSGQVLHRSTDPILPKRNGILYLEVMLSLKDCPPPPDGDDPTDDPLPTDDDPVNDPDEEERPTEPQGDPPKIRRIVAEPDEPRVGEEIKFAAEVEGASPVGWIWHFGDGEASEAEHPVHDYKEPDVYVVTVEVKNDFGSASAERNLTVAPNREERPTDRTGLAPKILRLAKRPAEPKVGEETLFFASVEGDEPMKYKWAFGDGKTSTEDKPRHAYGRAGDYTATLKVVNEAGSASAETSLTVSGGGTPVRDPLRPVNPTRPF